MLRRRALLLVLCQADFLAGRENQLRHEINKRRTLLSHWTNRRTAEPESEQVEATLQRVNTELEVLTKPEAEGGGLPGLEVLLHGPTFPSSETSDLMTRYMYVSRGSQVGTKAANVPAPSSGDSVPGKGSAVVTSIEAGETPRCVI